MLWLVKFQICNKVQLLNYLEVIASSHLKFGANEMLNLWQKKKEEKAKIWKGPKVLHMNIWLQKWKFLNPYWEKKKKSFILNSSVSYFLLTVHFDFQLFKNRAIISYTWAASHQDALGCKLFLWVCRCLFLLNRKSLPQCCSNRLHVKVWCNKSVSWARQLPFS